MKLRSVFAALNAALLCILLAASPAGSGSMMLLGVGKAGGAAPAFSLTFTDSNGSSTNATTVDFGIRTYGSGCTRVAVATLLIQGAGATTVSNISVGGTNLAQIPGAYNSQGGGGSVMVDVWESTAALAGTSGDVQVTYSIATGGNGASVGVYCLVTTSPNAGTPVASSAGCCVATGTASGVVIPAGGGALVAMTGQNGHSITFTNATQDVDVLTPPFSANQYYAHTTSTGTLTVTGTFSSNDGPVISVVPWGP